jgi:hypothetical protein
MSLDLPALTGNGRGGFRTCDLSRVKRDGGEREQLPEQGRLFDCSELQGL